MTALGVSQIEPALDAFKPGLEAVHAAHQDCLIFLDIGDAHLHVPKIFEHAINLRVHSAQENEDNVVRFVNHGATIPVLSMFSKSDSTTEPLQW